MAKFIEIDFIGMLSPHQNEFENVSGFLVVHSNSIVYVRSVDMGREDDRCFLKTRDNWIYEIDNHRYQDIKDILIHQPPEKDSYSERG